MWKMTFTSKSKNNTNYLTSYQYISNLIHNCSSSIDKYIYGNKIICFILIIYEGLFDNYCYLLNITERARIYQIKRV